MSNAVVLGFHEGVVHNAQGLLQLVHAVVRLPVIFQGVLHVHAVGTGSNVSKKVLGLCWAADRQSPRKARLHGSPGCLLHSHCRQSEDVQAKCWGSAGPKTGQLHSSLCEPPFTFQGVLTSMVQAQEGVEQSRP